MGLRQIVGEFWNKKSNSCPTWEAYRELMLGFLIGLNKCHGVSPVVVGETWRQMSANIVLEVMVVEYKEACRTEQLCGGLEAGNERGIHVVRLLLQ